MFFLLLRLFHQLSAYKVLKNWIEWGKNNNNQIKRKRHTAKQQQEKMVRYYSLSAQIQIHSRDKPLMNGAKNNCHAFHLSIIICCVCVDVWNTSRGSTARPCINLKKLLRAKCLSFCRSRSQSFSVQNVTCTQRIRTMQSDLSEFQFRSVRLNSKDINLYRSKKLCESLRRWAGQRLQTMCRFT